MTPHRRAWLRVIGPVLLLVLALCSQASAQSSNFNDAVLDIPIKRGQAFDVKKLLTAWGIKLGHVIVADKQIANQTIRFLTVESKLSWRLFKQILAMNGISLIEEEVSPGRFLIRVHMQRNLQANEGPPYLFLKKDAKIPDRSQIVTAVLQIRHGAGNEIFATVRGLQNRDRRRIGNILHVRGPEVIIIVDLAPNVSYYQKVIRALDVAAPSQTLVIRELQWAKATELAQVLQQILQQQAGGGGARGGRPAGAARPAAPAGGGGGAGTQAQVIAHAPTNQIIIRAFDYQLAEIDNLIKELDIRVREPGPKFHVYKCHDADANELADKLIELFTGQSSSFSNQSGSRRSGGSSRTSGSNSTGGSNSNRNSRPTPRPTPRPAPRRAVGGVGGAQGNALNVDIVPDELTNTLLIQAEEEDYIVILQLLRQLDRKKRRVFIEAQIWEVSAGDDLFIATELATLDNTRPGKFRALGITNFGASTVDTATDANGTPIRFSRFPGSVGVSANAAGGVAPTINFAQGLTGFLSKDQIDKIPVLLSTLEGENLAKIITRPFAVTNDNVEAEFKVTQREPFQTTTVNNVASQQNVQFVDAESTLTVTPTVHNNDTLTLELNLVISSFGTRADPSLPPPTNSREYQGTVTVPNGKFIVFGGLESNSTSYVESKVPLLGDIPILGHLFKSWRRNKSSTKVYIFIRPVVFSSTQFREDLQLASALHKRAHIESEREEWVAPILPTRIKRSPSELQGKLFEMFGTGSANPFRKR